MQLAVRSVLIAIGNFLLHTAYCQLKTESNKSPQKSFNLLQTFNISNARAKETD